jgi:hypothetical protein
MATNMATPIEQIPNIGRSLAAELRSCGIDSLEALMRVGFWDAWLQLRRANPERDCVPSCLALAGAVGRRALEPPPAESSRRHPAAREGSPRLTGSGPLRFPAAALAAAAILATACGKADAPSAMPRPSGPKPTSARARDRWARR